MQKMCNKIQFVPNVHQIKVKLLFRAPQARAHNTIYDGRRHNTKTESEFNVEMCAVLSTSLDIIFTHQRYRPCEEYTSNNRLVHITFA